MRSRLPPTLLIAGYRLDRALTSAVRMVAYAREWRRYERLAGGRGLRLRDAYPQLLDRGVTTPYDPHYFHQSVWAARRIAGAGPTEHVDVGSLALFVGLVSIHVPVLFVDIRPLDVVLENLRSVQGSLEHLPFADQSVESVSCMHVVEHVGLGRYGDPLDPEGTIKACLELQRVVAPGGTLYVSTPVGRPRVCFNAHRIHDPRTILDVFSELELAEFSLVDDAGRLHVDARPERAANLTYGCGLFRFTRPLGV